MKRLSVAIALVVCLLTANTATSRAEGQAQQSAPAAGAAAAGTAASAGASIQSTRTIQSTTKIQGAAPVSAPAAATAAAAPAAKAAPAAAAPAAAPAAANRVVGASGDHCLSSADPMDCKIEEHRHGHVDHREECDKPDKKYSDQCRWDRGYTWAKIHNLSDPSACSGPKFSAKFSAGCIAYVKDNH